MNCSGYEIRPALSNGFFVRNTYHSGEFDDSVLFAGSLDACMAFVKDKLTITARVMPMPKRQEDMGELTRPDGFYEVA